MRRALPVIISAAAAALLAACATTPVPQPLPPPRPAPPPPPPPTPLEEFSWSARPGQNSLTGVVAYRTGVPGQVWSCAGQSVALTPETSYSRGRMVALYGSADRAMQTVASVRARSAANPGLDYAQFVRSTSCTAQETFAFAGLPDGAYYIIARVSQTRPVSTGDGMVIMQRVELRGGQAVRLTIPQGAAAAPVRPAPRPAAPAPRPPARAR